MPTANPFPDYVPSAPARRPGRPPQRRTPAPEPDPMIDAEETVQDAVLEELIRDHDALGYLNALRSRDLSLAERLPYYSQFCRLVSVQDPAVQDALVNAGQGYWH